MHSVDRVDLVSEIYLVDEICSVNKVYWVS